MEKFYLSKALLAGGGVHPPYLPPPGSAPDWDIAFPDLGSFEDTTLVFLL